MSKTSMNIRLDSEVKEQAQQVFNHLGIDMTTAINIFLRQAIQYQDLLSMNLLTIGKISFSNPFI